MGHGKPGKLVQNPAGILGEVWLRQVKLCQRHSEVLFWRKQCEVKFATKHLQSKLHYGVTSLHQQLHLPERANLVQKPLGAFV